MLLLQQQRQHSSRRVQSAAVKFHRFAPPSRSAPFPSRKQNCFVERVAASGVVLHYSNHFHLLCNLSPPLGFRF